MFRAIRVAVANAEGPQRDPASRPPRVFKPSLDRIYEVATPILARSPPVDTVVEMTEDIEDKIDEKIKKV